MASRVSRGSATGFSFREIDHLGLCPEFLLEPERPWAPGELCHLAIGVGKVAKNDGPGRARLGAGGDVFPRLDLAILSEGRSRAFWRRWWQKVHFSTTPFWRTETSG